MDLNKIQENQMIERYILGQMGEQEAAEFEAYFLSNQECLDQLEMAEKLYQGLEAMEDAEVPLVAQEPSPPQVLPFWRKQVALPTWSLAAALLIFMFPLYTLLLGPEQTPLPVNNLKVMPLPSAGLRGEAGTTIVDEQGVQLVLSLYVDSALYPSYQFSLKEQKSEKLVLLSPNLTLASDDTLYINLGKDVVKKGRYQYQIEGISSTNESVQVLRGELVFDK